MRELLTLVLLGVVAGGGQPAAAQRARATATPRHAGTQPARPVVIVSREIACDTLTTAQLGLSGEELARVRQSRARILLVYGAPFLVICRQSPADTVWTRIRVPRRRLWDQELLYAVAPMQRTEVVRMDTCNMDRQGMPEVLLTCESTETAKSAVDTRIIHLLDVSHAPRLLLSALVRVEGFSNRPVDFGRELRVGSSSGSGFPVTPLVPGRYRYQGGQLVRVSGKER